MSNWVAIDSEKMFSLDALNETLSVTANITLPSTIEVPTPVGNIPVDVPNPIPYKHTRLRFNDSLIHTPPLVLNSISNTFLKYYSF